jgi:hypothetical protein
MRFYGLILIIIISSFSINASEALNSLTAQVVRENIRFKRADRHETTRLINDCTPTITSRALIIAFEGTGAYEPILPAVMNKLNKTLPRNKFDKLNEKVLSSVRNELKKYYSRDLKWTGLMSGPMSELFTLKNGQYVDWYSFPSEEVELLAGLEEIPRTSLRQLYNNIKDSVASNPRGIQNAFTCIAKYIRKAKQMEIYPKIILISHSSGGRSLVKFAERIKRLKLDVDLAFSIDPVIEAHHAIEEVIPQKLGEPTRYLRWRITGGPYPYSAVWHRDHRNKLYVPNNVEVYKSFFQNTDRLGLKMGGDALRFGIHGSNIYGADNMHIKGLGIDAHGAICYNEKIIQNFRKLMENLLSNN